MNIRDVFALATIAVAAFALSSGTASSQQKTLKEQLVGAWALVSVETTPAHGVSRQNFGPHPKGILVLDASGRYALVEGRPDRPKFKETSNLRSGATAEEFAAAARPFGANFGTWSVDEADKTLMRKYDIALIPNNDANETKASVSISGDMLTLATTGTNGVRAEAVYHRAK